MNVFCSIIALCFTDCNTFSQSFLLSLIILMSISPFFDGFFMRFSGVLNAVERVFWGFILRFIHFTRGQVRVESCIFRISPYHVRVYYVFMLFFILLFHKVYFLTCNFFEKKQKNVRSDSFPWNSVQNRSKRQNNRKRVESSKARRGKSVTERERANTAKSEKMHSVPLSVIKNRPFEHGKGGKKKSKTPVARHP